MYVCCLHYLWLSSACHFWGGVRLEISSFLFSCFLEVSVSVYWRFYDILTPRIKAERIQFVPPMPPSIEQAEMEPERELHRHTPLGCVLGKGGPLVRL